MKTMHEYGIEKDYVDRGVQTSYPLSSSPSYEAKIANVLPSSYSTGTSGPLLDLSPNVLKLSPGIPSKSIFLGNISHPAVSENVNLDPTSPSSSTIRVRTDTGRHLVYIKPSELQRKSQRVVSLPETAPINSSRTQFQSTKLRLASLPERPKPDLSLEYNQSPEASCDSFGVDNLRISHDETLHRVSRAVDIPRTPSPPSSPESVLIIENSVHLPDSFLRNNSRQKKKEIKEEEGWITWASSPPKPIPALHGPLSLPYARCPSGAEGTIIEETNDISRVIWGLREDDAPAVYSHADTSAGNYVFTNSAPVPSAQKMASQKSRQSNILVNAGTVKSHFHETQKRALQASSMSYASVSNSVPSLSAYAEEFRESLSSGSTGMLRKDWVPGVDANSMDNLDFGESLTPVYPLGNQTSPRSSKDAAVLNMNGELFLQWQSSLVQQALRDSMLQLEYTPNGLPSLKHASPAFSPVAPTDVPASASYPRIFVESRPEDKVALPSQPPRRMSAIEIARQFRKDHPQMTLPTPPNSSSPQWSYAFSPYSATQEFLSPSPYQLLSSSFVQYQQLSSENPSGGNISYPVEHISSFNIGTDIDLTSLSSAQHVFKTRPVHDKKQPMSPMKHLDTQDGNFLLTPKSTRASHEAMVPHNTPVLASSSSVSPSTFHHWQDTSVSVTSPSKSPESRSRSLTYQQPRSIPLARLIQRRLSSVPEEDLNMDRKQSPSHSSISNPYGRQQQLEGNSFAKVRKQQVSPVVSPCTTRSSSPVTASLSPESRTSSGGLVDQTTWQSSPQVRLPGMPSDNPNNCKNDMTYGAVVQGNVEADGNRTGTSVGQSSIKSAKKNKGKKVRGSYAAGTLNPRRKGRASN